MHHLYEIGGGAIVSGVLVAFYGAWAKAYWKFEAKKLRDELNALKSKAKAKL